VVALAIAEHYLPKGQGGALPTTVEGALVGIADRLDTLVGCFATGQTPTGSADPFGLRRAALGVLAILLESTPDGIGARLSSSDELKLGRLVAAAARGYGDTLRVDAAHVDAVVEFLRTRLRGLLIEEGLPSQDVDAALAVTVDVPRDAQARARAVGLVPQVARAVFKRVANSLDDARTKGVAPAAAIEPALFVAEGNAEWRLHRALEAEGPAIEAARTSGDYRALFQALVRLEPAVTAFFDKGGVMVMDPDERLRGNRLALLTRLLAPFAAVADFRLLAQPAGAGA
jgi:glycyl-tRNA synthetase beta chain